MDLVTPSTNTQATPPPLLDLPQEEKKAPSAVTLLRTLHLKVLSSTASVVSEAAKARVFVPISALGWLSCATVNRLFKATSWVTDVAKNGEQAYALSKQVQELTHDLIDASQHVRDSRQAGMQTIASVAQAVPVLGTVVGIANSIAAKEAEAERAVTWWGKRYSKGVFEFLRYSSPYILQGLNFVSSKVETATGTLQAKLYTGMTNPDAMSDTFRNIADKTNAIRYKMINPQTPADAIKAPYNIKLVTAHKKPFVNDADTKEVRLINMNKIYSSIGPHIVSNGLLYGGISSLGSAASTAAQVAGNAAQALFTSIGNTSLASWISSGLNKSALGLEILMILPYGKQATASFLEQGGLPIYEIEKTFAKLPEVVTKHAVHVEGKVLEALAWADSKIEQVDNASKLHEHQTFINHLLNKTDTSLQELSNTIVEDCLDKGTKIICSDNVFEILKSKESIIAYAKSIDLDPHSPEFVQAIQDMATTGTILQGIDEAGKTAQKAASYDASSWRGWFEQGLQATVDSIGETRVGQGMQHLVKAVRPTATSVANTITTSAKQAKDITTHSIKKLLGKEQALSPKVQVQLDSWQKTALDLASTKAKRDSAALSHAALVEISGLWGALLQQGSSNDPFSRFLRNTYMNSVRPTLQKTLSALEAAHNLNAANYNFLSAHMDVNLQTELHMQQFLSEKAKAAHKVMQDESKGSFTQTLASGASWGFPILSWLFLSSQTLTVLPFIMQRVMPHVLRTTAANVQDKAKPFWFFLAHNTKEVVGKGAMNIRHSSQTIGGWLQQTFNEQIAQATGTRYIDPQRIENFKKLSYEEQEYLFERTKAPKTSYDIQIHETLKALDQLANPEQELSVLSLRDYFQLSTAKQQEILFAVAHSDAYKHFLDTDPERIVRKFNELPHNAKANLSCKTTGQYKKMTISDKERVRLAIAKNSQFFNEYSATDIETQMHWHHEMSWNHPVGWEFSQFEALDHTTNHRLRNILQLYASLDGQQVAICTPSKIEAMSLEQQEHLIDIINTYHPELADTFKQHYGVDIYKLFTTQHALEKKKIYSAIASLYNMLPPGQQAKLLELTPDELEAMSPEKKKELRLYLMHARNMPEDGDLLSTFNCLERMQQAEFRESKELAEIQKEAVVATIEKELANASLKLKALQRRITRLSDGEYLALKSQVEQTKHALDAARKDKEGTLLAFASMKEAKAPKQALRNAHNAIQEADKAIPLLKTQLKADSEQLTLLSSKLTHLHQLEHEQIQKLSNLNTLLGSNMQVDEILDESPKVVQAINNTLTNTLDEVGKSMVHSLVSVIKEKISKSDYKQAVAFSREFLDEAIKLRKKHLSVVEARIKNLKSELVHLKEQKAYDAISEKRLQLRAHTNFTLKLNQALLGKFMELRQEFETHIPQDVIRAAPAA